MKNRTDQELIELKTLIDIEISTRRELKRKETILTFYNYKTKALEKLRRKLEKQQEDVSNNKEYDTLELTISVFSEILNARK